MKATSFNDDAGRIIKSRAIGYSPKEMGIATTCLSMVVLEMV